MATVERLEIIINSKATGQGAKAATSDMDKLTKFVKQAAGAYLTMQTAQKALDFAKLGGEVQRASRSLDNLAKAAGTSGAEITAAIQKASDFTIDKMAAMGAANRAMVMDVAQSPAEFERLTKVAVSLGRAMGQDAAKSIDDFVTAAARQSTMIADNLGLTVKIGAATENYAAKIGKTADQLTDAEKKQSFLNEMLAQGEIKMAALGGTTLGAAEKMEVLSAALKDAKTDFAVIFAEMVTGEADVGALAESIRGLSGQWRNMHDWGIAAQVWLNEFSGSWVNFAGDLKRANTAYDNAMTQIAAGRVEWKHTSEIIRYAGATVLPEVESALDGVSLSMGAVAARTMDGRDSTERLQAALVKLRGETEKGAIERLAQEAERAQKALEGMADFATSYSSMLRDRKKSDEEYAKDAVDLEKEHQDKLAELAKKGQAVAVRIDEAAEQEKLATLKRKLEIALQQQSEFTDKTKQSTLMSKETQLETLQGQIAEQETLLDNYHAGRLVKAGANTSALLAEEDARYQEELRLLQESRKAQEEEQRRSLGQMLLQNMEAYGQMNGWTADEMFQMRLKIAEQYGLITAEGKSAAENMASNWAREMAVMRGDADSFFAAFRQQFDSMPTEKRIKITYELATPQTAEGRLGGVNEYQHGVASAPGGLAWVGEAGPELAFIPRGTRIMSAPASRSMTANFSNTNNIYDGTAAAILQQQQRHQIRRAFERSI